MKITDEQVIKQLIQLKNHGKTNQERIRSHAILLSNEGKTSKELAEIFFVAQRTIFQWFADYNERSIESFSIQRGRGRKTLLDVEKDKEIIKKHIVAYPHQPKKAYAATLEELQIEMSYDTFKRFLKKHSISAISV
jgi:transposase